MKKLLLPLLILSLIFIPSCKKTEPSPLDYQSYPFYVEGILNFDDTEYAFAMTMEGKDNAEMTFSSPDTLKGYTFTLSPDGMTLSYKDMSVELKGEKANLIRLVPSLFALSADTMESTEKTVLNSTGIILSKYKTDLGNVSVYVNESTLLPLRFEGDGFFVDILKFAPISPDTDTPPATPATTAPATGNTEKTE